eukprot:5786278-Alexandrium_andersonii.AAC.1
MRSPTFQKWTVGAALRAAPPALGSALWESPKFSRCRASDSPGCPVGRAGTVTSLAGCWGPGKSKPGG